ncbi:MAG: chorismate mutase [Clostridiaceae bacterium]
MVRAVRGATTVNENNRNEILEKTGELLNIIVEKNAISREDIISVIFSVTSDLNAVFPAVAARNMGWTDIALMCTNEMDVPGSLRRCIRVMLNFNTKKSNSELKYIYLHEAEKLRPDLFENSLKNGG